MNMARLSAYEKMILRAERKGILIDQNHVSEKIPAAALRINGEDVGIFIDERFYETDTRRRLAFAHELAHCETESFYTEATPVTKKLKSEYKANKRTVSMLVPFNLYKSAILKGILTEWEQAEYWNIPVDYVSTVHAIYERTRSDDVLQLKMMAEGKE